MGFVEVQREFASFVRIEGPGVNRQTFPLFDLPQQLRKLHRLFRIGEHILTAGEPVVDVVQPAFNQQPSPTRNLQKTLYREATTTLSTLFHLAPMR